MPHPPPRRLHRLRTAIARLGHVGVLGLLWLALPAVAGLWTLAKLGPVAELWGRDPSTAIWMWSAIMAVTLGVGLLPITTTNVLYGWVYGWGPGCFAAMCTYQVAALIGYFIARHTSHARVDTLIEEDDTARRVRWALLHQSRGRAVLIVALWRLSGFPFPFSNLVLTSCGVRLPTYQLATLVGMLPRVLVATFVSSTAARTGARDIVDLVRRSQHPVLLLIGGALALGVLAMITYIARTALQRATADADADRDARQRDAAPQAAHPGADSDGEKAGAPDGAGGTQKAD